MLVTSEINMSSKDIYNAYHQLWQIEESFRIMKSELDTRPVYLQKENRIKGHFFICYTAVLLSRILQFKILENKCSKYNIRFHEKISSCKNQLHKIHKSINQQRIRNRFIQKIKSTNNKLLSNR